MLMIRLARFGAKKKPTYRARDSRCVEVVGHYNPVAEPAQVSLKHDRVEHWLRMGAKPSDTVARLMKNNPQPVAEPAA
jgi:small subunit ribosomal protein S16